MLCVLAFKSNIVRSKLEWDNETLYSSTKLDGVPKKLNNQDKWYINTIYFKIESNAKYS